MNCGEAREVIQLYMDDELEARDTLTVQKHLESCAGCSRQLERLLEQDRVLRDASRAERVDNRLLREKILNAILDNRPVQPMVRIRWVDRWSARPAWRRVAAIVVLTIAAGLLLSKAGLLPYTTQNVYAAVVSDHADHCSVDSKLAAITDGGELDRLIRTFGKLSRAPDVSDFGYDDVRGRTCKVNGVLFLHLVYYSSERARVSVFLGFHASSLPTDDFSVVREREYEVVSVSKSGVDLLVVSSIPNDQITAITESIAAQL